MVGVPPIEDKMRENRPRWVGHLQCRLAHAVIRRTNIDAVKGNTREGVDQIDLRGGSLKGHNIMKHDVIDIAKWRKRIHIANANSLRLKAQFGLVLFS